MNSVDKIIEASQMAAYDAWRSTPNRDAYVMQGFAHAAALTAAAVEARVRAEVAEEIAVKLEAEAVDVLGDGYIDGLNFGVKIARLAAGSSPDTTPDPQQAKVKLWTSWVSFSVAAENHPFTDEQRNALAGHEDHQTGGAWSAFGWRSLACMTCDVTVWSITAPQAKL